jgi:hypothetical protein
MIASILYWNMHFFIHFFTSLFISFQFIYSHSIQTAYANVTLYNFFRNYFEMVVSILTSIKDGSQEFLPLLTSIGNGGQVSRPSR